MRLCRRSPRNALAGTKGGEGEEAAHRMMVTSPCVGPGMPARGNPRSWSISSTWNTAGQGTVPAGISKTGRETQTLRNHAAWSHSGKLERSKRGVETVHAIDDLCKTGAD